MFLHISFLYKTVLIVFVLMDDVQDENLILDSSFCCRPLNFS